MAAEVGLRLDNIGPLINRLEKFDQDISKELKKQMRQASGPLVAEARSVYPSVGLTNWGPWTYSRDGRDLSYQIGTVRKGPKLRQSRVRDRRSSTTVGFGYTVIQTNPAGAIIEFAGKKSRDRFSQSVIGRYGPVGKVPRFLTQAYYSVAPGVRREIESYVKAAMRKVGM